MRRKVPNGKLKSMTTSQLRELKERINEEVALRIAELKELEGN